LSADISPPPRYASTMRPSQFRVALFCIVSFASFALQAQQAATTPVTIRVSDPTGAGIPHAQIRLVPAPEQAPAKLETDDHGQLTLNLKTGGYALFVSAQGFAKDTRHIDIAAPEVQASASQVVTVVLEVGRGGGPTVYSTPVEGSLTLTADPYHAPLITITVHNGHTNAAETYSGVALATLLAKVNAPLGKELHGEAMTSYVVGSGSDGYSVVLSLAEVDPSFHEGQVIVADTRDGQPLGKSGPFQLIVSDDKRPARWVHNLETITLKLR
jgi:hypothetical protein